MIAIYIPGEPVAFARAGSCGKRRYTPQKQAGFANVARHYAQRAMNGQAPLEGALRMTMRAVYLHPESWSQKKKNATLWKSSKPDADNLAKIIKDALSTIVYRDDAQIAELIVQKQYGPIAGVTVSVERLEILTSPAVMAERESAGESGASLALPIPTN